MPRSALLLVLVLRCTHCMPLPEESSEKGQTQFDFMTTEDVTTTTDVSSTYLVFSGKSDSTQPDATSGTSFKLQHNSSSEDYEAVTQLETDSSIMFTAELMANTVAPSTIVTETSVLEKLLPENQNAVGLQVKEAGGNVDETATVALSPAGSSTAYPDPLPTSHALPSQDASSPNGRAFEPMTISPVVKDDGQNTRSSTQGRGMAVTKFETSANLPTDDLVSLLLSAAPTPGGAVTEVYLASTIALHLSSTELPETDYPMSSTQPTDKSTRPSNLKTSYKKNCTSDKCDELTSPQASDIGTKLGKDGCLEGQCNLETSTSSFEITDRSMNQNLCGNKDCLLQTTPENQEGIEMKYEADDSLESVSDLINGTTQKSLQDDVNATHTRNCVGNHCVQVSDSSRPQSKEGLDHVHCPQEVMEADMRFIVILVLLAALSILGMSMIILVMKFRVKPAARRSLSMSICACLRRTRRAEITPPVNEVGLRSPALSLCHYSSLVNLDVPPILPPGLSAARLSTISS